MSIVLTRVPSSRSGTELSELQGSLDELAEFLANVPVSPDKDGPAIIPASFNRCPAACRNAGRPGSIYCGGGKYHRLGANVRAVTALGLDFDHMPPGALEGVLSALTTKGIAFFWWHTYNHSPPNDSRARVLIPFAEPFELRSPAHWSKGAWPMLVAHLGLDKAAVADSACRDPARVFYLPRKPDTSAHRESHYVRGTVFDWRPVLGDKLNGFSQAANVPARVPVEDSTKPVDLAALKTKLKKSKSPLVARLLAGEPLSPKPDLRKPGEPSRYEAWRSVTASVSMFVEEWQATDALLELLRPSWQAEVQEDPDEPTEWQTVVDLFARARASAPQRKAERDAERSAARTLWESVTGAAFTAKEAPAEAPPTPAGDLGAWLPGADALADALEGEALMSELDITVDKEGGHHVKKTLANLDTLLHRSATWRGAVRRNKMARQVEVWRGPIFNGAVKPIEKTDYYGTKRWFAKNPAIAVEWPQENVDSALDYEASLFAYDPLVEYLRGVRWDGVSRIDTMLETYFNVRPASAAQRKYVRAVSAKWMISAAARGLKPGSKVDTTLVFRGVQGQRKTAAFAVLGGQWYVEFSYPLDSDEARLVASSKWIGEFGELKSIRTAEVEQVKAFLTRTHDTYRVKYERQVTDHPRRIVFAASTNDDEIFNDPTGNRRFWPVSAGQVDLEGLTRDRDALWAEAVKRYDAGDIWHLTPDEEVLAAKEVADYAVTNPYADAIVRWYSELEPSRRLVQVTLNDVSKRILDREIPVGKEQRDITHALRTLGFVPGWRYRGTAQQRIWNAPSNLLDLPKITVDRSTSKPAVAEA